MTAKLVHHILEHAAARFPEKIALRCGEDEYSYRYLNHQADILAAALLRMGMRPQDRGVIYLENCVESVIALFAILKAGGIFVVVNPAVKARKLRFLLQDTGALLLVTSISKMQAVRGAVAETEPGAPADYRLAGNPSVLPLKHIALAGTDNLGEVSSCPSQVSGIALHDWNDLLNQQPGEEPPPRILDVDLAALIYTSGSSGVPKGVMSAHYNMLAAVESIDTYLENDQNERILCVLPFSFDYGLYQIFLSFHVGATLILAEFPVYPYQLLELLANEKITAFPLVPTIAVILSKSKPPYNIYPSGLRYITNTGDRLTQPMIDQLRDLFPQTKIFKMYGLTECKRATYLPPDQLPLRPDSVGIPIPNCQAKIVNAAGLEVGPNEVGELVIRGSNVMQGYWKMPEETAQVFKHVSYRADAQLYTNDFFTKDEAGFLYFLGRKDDLIKVKGEMVSLKEIACFLESIDGVLKSQVISIPHDLLGRYIVAYLVKDIEVDLKENVVLAACTVNLDPNLVPKKIIFLESFPVTLNGKIDVKFLTETAISS